MTDLLCFNSKNLANHFTIEATAGAFFFFPFQLFIIFMKSGSSLLVMWSREKLRNGWWWQNRLDENRMLGWRTTGLVVGSNPSPGKVFLLLNLFKLCFPSYLHNCMWEKYLMIVTSIEKRYSKAVPKSKKMLPKFGLGIFQIPTWKTFSVNHLWQKIVDSKTEEQYYHIDPVARKNGAPTRYPVLQILLPHEKTLGYVKVAYS